MRATSFPRRAPESPRAAFEVSGGIGGGWQNPQQEGGQSSKDVAQCLHTEQRTLLYGMAW